MNLNIWGYKPLIWVQNNVAIPNIHEGLYGITPKPIRDVVSGNSNTGKNGDWRLTASRIASAIIGYGATRFFGLHPIPTILVGGITSTPATLIALGTWTAVQGGKAIIQSLAHGALLSFVKGMLLVAAGLIILENYEIEKFPIHGFLDMTIVNWL